MTTTSVNRLAALPRKQLLRLALRVDAVVSGANGIAYLALAEPLDDLLGLPADLTRPVGAFLVLYALAVWAVSNRPRPAAVRAIIAGNLAWAAASIGFAAGDAASPTTAGTVWTVLQALVVAGFAAAQYAAANAPAGGRS
jgi:hypothetical protein